MIVEFIGVPGVGKTSVLDRMRAINDLENFNIVFKDSNLKPLGQLRSALFIFKFFINYASSLKLFFTSFRWLIIKLSHRSCFHIVDEKHDYVLPLKTNGMLMPIISYAVQRNTDNIKYEVTRVLDMLPLPDVLIVVTANIENIVKRYSFRGGFTLPDRKSRQNVIVNSELYKNFNSGLNAVEKVVDFAQKKKVKILRLDNNQDINDDKLRLLMMEIIND